MFAKQSKRIDMKIIEFIHILFHPNKKTPRSTYKDVPG